MIRIKRSLFPYPVAFVLALAAGAYGAEANLEEVIEAVQGQYERMADFQAKFQQTSIIKSLNRTKRASGLIYFKKPGMMRWDYEKNGGQKIISDGRTLWMYFPEDNQVQVGRFSKEWLGKAPAAFLLGLGRLKRDFEISFARPRGQDEAGNYSLALTPREPIPSIKMVVLTVDRDSFQVIASTLTDALGNVTEIRFREIKANQGLKDSLFAFSVPPEAEVIQVTPSD